MRNSQVGRGRISLSRIAYNCRVGLSIIRNNRKIIEQELPLQWLGSNQLPRKCNYGGSFREGTQGGEVLPFSYLGSLFAQSSDSTKFLVGTENDVLLLVTFEDSERAYVITHLGTGITEEGLTPLDFNTEYVFHIRFYSDAYRELYQKRLKFNATSWDIILFS